MLLTNLSFFFLFIVIRVSPGDYDKVVALVAKFWPLSASKCAGHLRHKEAMILPSVLKANNINFDVIRQKPGKKKLCILLIWYIRFIIKVIYSFCIDVIVLLLYFYIL